MGNETTDVTKPVMQALEAAGAMVCRNNTGRRGWVSFGLRKGSADVIAIVPPYGRILSVETKVPTPKLTPTGKPSKAKGQGPRPEQIRWAEDVRRAGGVAVFATTVEEALEGLREARMHNGRAAEVR